VFARYADRFLRRVFTDAEMAYCTRRPLLTITHAETLATAQAQLFDDPLARNQP
jgi:phosphopantetheinyl transferase (holo-ACP synthase)